MTAKGNASFAVSTENPGEFFACMGILYCADQMFNRAAGHFKDGRFVLETDCDGSPLDEIIRQINSDRTDEPLKRDAQDNDKATPVTLRSMGIRLDFWKHFDERPKIKLFAGQEKSWEVVGRWVCHLREVDRVDGLRDFAVTSLPSGLDTSTSWNSLDVGFSLNHQKIRTKTYPLVEFFAYVGVQTYGWKRDGLAFYYNTWQAPLPFTLARARRCRRPRPSRHRPVPL